MLTNGHRPLTLELYHRSLVPELMWKSFVRGALVVSALILLACTASPTATDLAPKETSTAHPEPTPDIEATVESLLQERLADTQTIAVTPPSAATITPHPNTPTSPAQPTPNIDATVESAVRATIAARFRITLTPKTGGFWDALLDPEPGPDGRYPAGTEVQLRAFLNLAHSVFVRWEGDASGSSATTTVVVDHDLEVHAVFLHIGTATAQPPTRTPVPTPASGPLAAPTAAPQLIPGSNGLPISKPTPLPAAPPEVSAVRIDSITSPIQRGTQATLEATAPAGAECRITVRYKSGPSKAAGLEPKRADARGTVFWNWSVGGRTTPGDWPVEVRCAKEGLDAVDTVTLTVVA